jgi:hypothetical protein
LGFGFTARAGFLVADFSALGFAAAFLAAGLVSAFFAGLAASVFGALASTGFSAFFGSGCAACFEGFLPSVRISVMRIVVSYWRWPLVRR